MQFCLLDASVHMGRNNCYHIIAEVRKAIIYNQILNVKLSSSVLYVYLYVTERVKS